MSYLLLFMQILLLFLLIVFYVTDHSRATTKIQGEDFSSQIKEWQKTVVELIKELENVSGEILSQIKSKMEEMDLKIAEADKKIKSLKTLIPEVSSWSEPNLEGKLVKKRSPNKSLPPKHGKIYQLADQGWNVVDIAEKTRIGKGEIQLILDLRRQVISKEVKA